MRYLGKEASSPSSPVNTKPKAFWSFTFLGNLLNSSSFSLINPLLYLKVKLGDSSSFEMQSYV